MNRFHLAIPVHDLASARSFYGSLLGCSEGRSDTSWIDFNLFGHQIVTHQVPGYRATEHFNPVDEKKVPVPHFGVILEPAAWRTLAERLRKANVDFVIEPYTRFEGETGEQSTLFLRDPSGNALEFKGFADFDQIFAAD